LVENTDHEEMSGEVVDTEEAVVGTTALTMITITLEMLITIEMIKASLFVNRRKMVYIRNYCLNQSLIITFKINYKQ
jgi:hypothetical protein